MSEREIQEFEIGGHKVSVDVALGHLWVAHDGTITWDEVNNANIRHLWRLGDSDFCPDPLGRRRPDDSLEARHKAGWEGV